MVEPGTETAADPFGPQTSTEAPSAAAVEVLSLLEDLSDDDLLVVLDAVWRIYRGRAEPDAEHA